MPTRIVLSIAPSHAQWPCARLRTAAARLAQAGLLGGLALGLLSTSAGSQLLPCSRAADNQRVASALERIERSVDPCGESAQVLAVLRTVKACPKAAYQICTNAEIDRNLFERPFDNGSAVPRTITWNPGLRSELEPAADGDTTKAVQRDPTASLLHELVHAAYDCRGANAGEHEIDAVRIENIYRRAVGLRQRSGYGEERLPPQLTRECTPGRCLCAAPAPPNDRVRRRSAMHHTPSSERHEALARRQRPARNLGEQPATATAVAAVRAPADAGEHLSADGTQVDPLSVAAQEGGPGSADRRAVGDRHVVEHAGSAGW